MRIQSLFYSMNDDFWIFPYLLGHRSVKTKRAGGFKESGDGVVETSLRGLEDFPHNAVPRLF
mgnify:CR=1 FL=1